MKICFVSPHSFERPGGVRTHILNLCRIYEEQGHECWILAPRQKKLRTVFNSNIPNLVEVGIAPMLPLTGTYVEIAIFTRSEIQKFFQKNKFDIIHFHNFGPFISTDAFYFSKKTPKILTFHVFPKGIANKIFTTKNVKTISNLFKYIIFVSKSQEKMYKEIKRNVSVIPNGIEIYPNITPRDISNKKQITLLYVGRIEERKGVGFLVDAFKIIDKKLKGRVRLQIVGSGPKEYMDKILADIQNNPRIELLGSISDDELKKVRRSADICASPAYDGESFGIVLLESIALGVPIVAFDNPGYRSVMTGELKDCLTESKNAEKFAAKIIELIENPDHYKQLSQYGINHAKQYDWKIISQKVMDIYKKSL